MKVSKKNSLLIWGGAIILIIFIVYFINKNRKIEHFYYLDDQYEVLFNAFVTRHKATKEDLEILKNMNFNVDTEFSTLDRNLKNTLAAFFSQAVLNMSESQKNSLNTNLKNFFEGDKIGSSFVGKELIKYWYNNGFRKSSEELTKKVISDFYPKTPKTTETPKTMTLAEMARSVPAITAGDSGILKKMKFKTRNFSNAGLIYYAEALFGQAVRNMSDSERKNLTKNITKYFGTNSSKVVGEELIKYWYNNGNHKTPEELTKYLKSTFYN